MSGIEIPLAELVKTHFDDDNNAAAIAFCGNVKGANSIRKWKHEKRTVLRLADGNYILSQPKLQKIFILQKEGITLA